MPRILSDQEEQALGIQMPSAQSKKGARILGDDEAESLGFTQQKSTSNPVIDATKYLGRPIARAGIRAAESAAGTPFDIANMGLSAANLAHRGVTGEWSPGIEKAKEYLPTAESLRKNVTEKYLPDELTKPQNEYEELADNLVSDFVSIMTPVGALGLVGKGGKAAKAAAKTAAAASGFGNSAGFLTKNITGNKTAGDVVKAGVMLGVSLAGAPKMFGHGGELYTDMTKSIPETLNTTTKSLIEAEKEASNLMKGHGGTKAADAFTDYFNKNAHLFNAESSAPLKEIIDARKGFGVVVKENPSMWKDLNPAVKVIKGGFDKAVKNAGRPDIYKKFKEANEFWSEAMTAANTQNWIDKAISGLAKSPISIGAQVLLGVTNPSKIGYIAASQGGLAAMKGLSSIIKRAPGFMKVPVVQRYYINTILSALNENRPGFIKHARQFDKALAKAIEGKSPD